MKVANILLEIIVCLCLPFSLQGQALVSKRWRYETTASGTKIQVTRTEESRQTGTKEQMRISKIKSTDVSTQSGVETTNYPDINDDFCFSVGACHPPATFSYFDWYCNCDRDCENYNDCCLQHNFTITNDQHVYECINLDTEKTAYRGFQAISRCPLGYGNKTVDEKCMSGNLVESGPPVAFGNDIMFKNKYCALCYDVKEYIPFEVEFYNIKMTSDEYEYFQNQTKKSKLSYIFMNADYKLVLPPSLNLRICVLNLIDNSQTHCQRYINPTVVLEGRDLRVYRNEFCMSDYDKQNGFDCFARFMRLLWLVVDINTLSVIFSFKETKLEKEGDITCQKWSEEIERSNSCAHLETYDNYVINLEYYVVSPKNQSKSELVGIGLVSLWTFVVTNFTKCSSKIILEASESQMIVRVTASLLVTKKLFSNEIHEIEKSFNEQELDIVIKDNSTENVAVVKKRNNISGIENDLVTRFDVILRMHISPSAKDGFFSGLLQANNIYTPVMNLMFCIYHKVFVNSFPDGGIYIDSEKNLCDRIQVLESTSNLALITYVCFSLSVISLAFVISFNRKHKFHCSVPGSNMENLSTSLLLANIVFMFGIGASRIYRVCYVAGIILHYLWLTVFSYMTIAIAHIVYTISQLKPRNSIKHEDVVKKRCMVTFVGLLIPLLIVIPGIVVDQFGPEYWSLGYGGSVCFPNKYPANIIFFSGPVVFGVAVDCICMVQIVTQICRVRMGMRHIRKLNIYEDAQIYLRIVVLSGVFWVTGIVAAISESEWLDYVFTILCGLQGFFIAVANMTTTRVLKTKRAVSKSLT